jgi:oligoribonuclease NrnB/cAMP/cGMP phosphodiesterase (DHH superfamily)
VEDLKIKLFTHVDLDGYGCTILAYLAFGKENVSVEYCEYETINDKVKQFVVAEDYKNYDYVYITDMSINEEVAELIHNTHPSIFADGFNLPEMVQLIDHHPTAMNLNKYWWCHVQIEDDKEKVSGTSLFFKELLNQDYLQETNIWKYDRCEAVEDFVEVIKRYDTWLWKTKYNDIQPKQLNDLLYIYGREDFINEMVKRLENHKEYLFSETDYLLLKLEERKIDEYIEKKNKELIKKGFKPNTESPLYNVGFVFAENYISELGNKLAEVNTDLDFIVIITNGKTISYRGIKDTIDLGKDIASIFGGGGHPKSAGSQINEELNLKMIHDAFGFE